MLRRRIGLCTFVRPYISVITVAVVEEDGVLSLLYCATSTAEQCSQRNDCFSLPRSHTVKHNAYTRAMILSAWHSLSVVGLYTFSHIRMHVIQLSSQSVIFDERRLRLAYGPLLCSESCSMNSQNNIARNRIFILHHTICVLRGTL